MYKQANLSFSVTAQAYGDDVNAIQFSTQDKNSAKLVFSIKEGKAPLNLADVDGIVDLVMGDKSVFEGNKAEVTGPLEGKLEYTITPEQIRHPGKVRGELKLVSKSGQTIGGFRFTFTIKKALLDEFTGPIKEFYIEDLEAVKKEVKQKADAVVLDIDKFKVDIDSRTAAIEEQIDSLDDDIAQSTVLQVDAAKKDTTGQTHANLDSRIKAEVGKITTKQGELAAALAETAKKSEVRLKNQKITQTDMSEELLQQMAGETPINAVPADYSIALNKLSFTPVIGKPSKNLFDKNNVTLNKNISATNGQLNDFADWFASDFILVEPNTSYVLRPNVTNSYAITYDESKKFISQVGRDFTTASNVKYVRFTTTIASLESAQLEKGTVFTGYEPFGAKLTNELIKDESLSGTALAQKSIPVNRISDIVIGKNLFNKDTVTDGFFAGNSTGILYPNSSYCVSDFIPIKPSTPYTRSFIDQIAFYAEDTKTYVGGSTNTSVATITSPSAAKYMRVSMPKAQKETYQIEEGNESTSYQPYQYEFKYLKKEAVQSTEYKRLYSFKDAWVAWENGEKFPIGFLGDSTTDGAGTSAGAGHEAQDNNAGGYGKVDYINKKAYPYLLEQLIKSETGKTQPRIYNIGYSGTRFDWVRPKINDIMGGVYSDTKMIGIQYGINDRLNAGVTTKMYEQEMREHLEFFVDYFYKKGIQPFIVTSQATVEPSPETTETIHPMRSTEAINSVANRVKRDIARKYNLEIMELTNFDEHLLTYSQYSLYQLINDRLHFGDIGHSIEAGYLFSYLCPRVIKITDDTRLSFTSQRMKSRVPGDLIQYVNPFEDGFKVKANYTKSDTNDLLMLDFWILNYSKKSLNLKAFVTTMGTQHVKVNDVDTIITSNGQTVATLDIGLHHIQAFTGASDKVDFKGFTLN